MISTYRICSRCIMDTSVSDIEFNEDGICNYCRLYENRVKAEVLTPEEAQPEVERLVKRIKRDGEGKSYDCVIGVSGGVDSTYVAYLVKKLGLRPLAVHLDNGWNAELAVSNIEKALKILDIDLYTYVLDWEEFRDIQNSFLKSSIANAEIPTDHAIYALLMKIASKNGVKYIIGGNNTINEGIMPKSWMYNALDLRLLKAVHRKYGTLPLKTYPQISLVKFAYYVLIRRIKFVPILNMINYRKKDAEDRLQTELGWRAYGGKHFESIFTRFFQSYILPRKFKMDKRKPHLSCLVMSGQMSREEALAKMDEPPCDPSQIKEDLEYVTKKLGLSENEFMQIMSTPIRSYSEYPSSSFIWNKIFPFGKTLLRRAMRG